MKITGRDFSAGRGVGDFDSPSSSRRESHQIREGRPSPLSFFFFPLARLHEQWEGLMLPGSNASSGCVATGSTWSGSHASGVIGSAR